MTAESLPPALMPGFVSGGSDFDLGRQLEAERKRERMARSRRAIEQSEVEAERSKHAVKEYQDGLLAEYADVIDLLAAFLEPVIARMTSGEPLRDLALLEKLGGLKKIAHEFKVGAEIENTKRQPPTIVYPLTHAHEPRTDGVVLYDHRCRERADIVTLGERRFYLVSGPNFIPADIAEIEPLEALVQTGRCELLPASAALKPMATADDRSPFARGEGGLSEAEARAEALAAIGIHEDVDPVVAHAAKLAIARRKSAASE